MEISCTMRTAKILIPDSRQFTRKSHPLHVLSCHSASSINFITAKTNLCVRSLRPFNSPWTGLSCLVKPVCAIGSGLAASLSEKDNPITVKNAKISVESQDDDKIQIRVDLKGADTQIIFDKVLTNLARTAPPIPGFRRQKGGKTSKVPKSFLLSILGEDTVTKFVIQEIIDSTLSDYVRKENLRVKENKINTIQTADELKLSFKAGKDFGFSAILDLEKSETEAISSSSSDP